MESQNTEEEKASQGQEHRGDDGTSAEPVKIIATNRGQKDLQLPEPRHTFAESRKADVVNKKSRPSVIDRSRTCNTNKIASEARGSTDAGAGHIPSGFLVLTMMTILALLPKNK